MRCKGRQGECLCRAHAPLLPNEPQTPVLQRRVRSKPCKDRIPVPGKFAERF